MVRRILRHAMSYRIFQEVEKGFVAHTGASKLLAEDGDLRQWIGMVMEEMWPAATKACFAPFLSPLPPPLRKTWGKLMWGIALDGRSAGTVARVGGAESFGELLRVAPIYAYEEF